jgi:hypothetical protein
LIASLAWRKWWSATGKSQLRLLALEHWDPLNVYDTPSEAAAYDAYLDRVGRMLRRGKGSAELAAYHGQVRTLAFKQEEREIADELFADRVLAWYAVEAPD